MKSVFVLTARIRMLHAVGKQQQFRENSSQVLHWEISIVIVRTKKRGQAPAGDRNDIDLVNGDFGEPPNYSTASTPR